MDNKSAMTANVFEEVNGDANKNVYRQKQIDCRNTLNWNSFRLKMKLIL